METNLISTARAAVKNWWVSLIIGILSLIFGIAFIFQPIDALFTLVALFVVGFFVAGICEIIFAITNKDSINGWAWALATGIIDILLGILLLSIPTATPVIMVYFVGFWIMFQSIWAIGMAIDILKLGVKDSGWEWLLALAISGIIFSFIFIISPVFSSGFIVIMATISFIVYGIYKIYLAIQLQSLKNKFGE